jgi:hypothetical protein
MTDEGTARLVRQAEWQRQRSRLPWEEKLRPAVAMRESLRSYGRTVPVTSAGRMRRPGTEPA